MTETSNTESRLNEMTDAVRETIIELLEPSASGNRTERSILPTLYRTMNEESRRAIARRALTSCFDDEEREYLIARLNDLEMDYFGSEAITF